MNLYEEFQWRGMLHDTPGQPIGETGLIMIGAIGRKAAQLRTRNASPDKAWQK
jgi:hypothetical protein